ncbi:hypothetical protein INS49_015642 [Diaporthe citri]|uniref:uncharacterized protein n=1 Tax=Diaporthe citri TaxID=83186 RepID=UPI001C802987|nr:uncharacterized protein INS49_015642 [Diaporthe citri]KAG6356255.1 hypothetical protein INS49_015642 [Diaporthe citri]
MFDYAKDLDRPHTAELRIGVLRKPDDTVDRHKLEAFNDGLSRLRSTGAIIIDPVAIPGLEEYESLSDAEKSVVLDTEFKFSLEEFLSNLAVNPRNIKTLGQLIETIKHDPSERFPEWNVEIMQRADHTSVHSPIYTKMRARQEYFASQGGIKGALETSDCHVLLAPAGSLAVQGFAAMAGSPAMSVPMGFYPPETEVVTDERTGQVVIGPNVPLVETGYDQITFSGGDGKLTRAPQIGPKKESGPVTGDRYHVKNYPVAPRWRYEPHPLQDVRVTAQLLARVTIAKVVDEERLISILESVPVDPPDWDGRASGREPKWTCRVWVIAALKAVRADGGAVGTNVLDDIEGPNGIIEKTKAFVARQVQRNRYGEGTDAMAPKPLLDLLTGKESYL